MSLVQLLDKKFGGRYQLQTVNSQYDVCWLEKHGKNTMSVHYIQIGNNKSGEIAPKHITDAVNVRDVVRMQSLG